MGIELFRVEPKGRVQDYKTYAVRMPLQTHTRVATCAEVECQHHLRGWRTTVDVSTELGQRQAKYIVNQSGRAFTQTPAPLTTLEIFIFPAGQRCFTEHRVSLEREAFFSMRDGDWRGNPTGRKVNFSSDRAWVDDFGEHQQRIADWIEQHG